MHHLFYYLFFQYVLSLCQSIQGCRNEKRAREADFVEGHRQNFNYVKSITRYKFQDFRCQLTVPQRVLLSPTKGTLKTYCYITFFIHKGHFCPLAPPSKRQGGQLPLLSPPSSFGVPESIHR